MRFFNLDLHIAVIADIKQIFESLGHQVTDWSISAQTWVFGREIDKVDFVNRDTWKSFDRQMCDAFYNRYKSELEVYDAFIVTHTPCFAMLYEKWNKPIICVASTRYEYPFSNNRRGWEELNAYLRTKIDEGVIIPVANNKYDAAYAETFTQRAWQVIPSLCAYTDAPYTGKLSSALYYSKFKGLPKTRGLVSKDERFKRSFAARVASKLGSTQARRAYRWQDIADFRSVVYVPYQASIMSIFEMYTAGIPMLFPSLSFARTLYESHHKDGVFSELSFNQIKGFPSRSILPCEGPDPNNYEDTETMMHWMALSDFYDVENMKGLGYFDSFEELGALLEAVDVEQMHGIISAHASVRSERVHAQWSSVLKQVSQSSVR